MAGYSVCPHEHENSQNPVVRSEQCRCMDTPTFAMLKAMPREDEFTPNECHRNPSLCTLAEIRPATRMQCSRHYQCFCVSFRLPPASITELEQLCNQPLCLSRKTDAIFKRQPCVQDFTWGPECINGVPDLPQSVAKLLATIATKS